MKKLIIANWKMNPKTLFEARILVSSIEHRMHLFQDRIKAVVCPPSIYLPPLSHYCHYLGVGAQNVHWEESGAYTGEISALQAKQWKTSFVILGHSERRMYFGENDIMVRLKADVCIKNRMTPIICLGGDSKASQDSMKRIVNKQLKSAIKGLDKESVEKIVFVYEPIWAISSQKNSVPATGEHASEMTGFIRSLLSKIVGAGKAFHMPVLYGGSVNKKNVHEFARYPHIDGCLVGASSLEADAFISIIKEFHREAIHK
jgi:triosephosphate isomerase (TIM)